MVSEIHIQNSENITRNIRLGFISKYFIGRSGKFDDLFLFLVSFFYRKLFSRMFIYNNIVWK